MPADDPLQLAASRVAATSADAADANPARMGSSPSAAAPAVAAAPASTLAGFEFEYGLADAKDDSHAQAEAEAEGAVERALHGATVAMGSAAAGGHGMGAAASGEAAMMQPSALYQYLGLRQDGEYLHHHRHRHHYYDHDQYYDDGSLDGASKWGDGVGLDVDALDASGSLRTGSACSFDHDAAAAQLLTSAAPLSPAAARRAASKEAASSRSKRGASSWARSGPRFTDAVSKPEATSSSGSKLSQTDALRQRLAGAASAAQARSLQAAQALPSSGVAYRVVEAFGRVRVARVKLASPSRGSGRASRSPATTRRGAGAGAAGDDHDEGWHAEGDDTHHADEEHAGGDDPLRASQMMAMAAAGASAALANGFSSRGRRLHAAHAPLLPGFSSPLAAAASATTTASVTRAAAGRWAAAAASDPRVGAGSTAGFVHAQQTPRTQLVQNHSGSAGGTSADMTVAGSPASQLPVRALWAAATPGSSSSASAWAGDVTGIRDVPLHDGDDASTGAAQANVRGNAHEYSLAHAHAQALPLWEEPLTEGDLCYDDDDDDDGDIDEADDEEEEEAAVMSALAEGTPGGFYHGEEGSDGRQFERFDEGTSCHRLSPTRAFAAAAAAAAASPAAALQSQSPFPRFGIPRDTRMHLARRSGAADPVRRFAATQRARARQASVGSAHRAAVATSASAAGVSPRSGRSLSPRSAQLQAHAWGDSSVRSPLAAEHWGWASNDDHHADDAADSSSAAASDSLHYHDDAGAARPFARVDSTVALANSHLEAVAAAAALEWEQGLGVMRLLAAQTLEDADEDFADGSWAGPHAASLPAWAVAELALGLGDGFASEARTGIVHDDDGDEGAAADLGLLLLETEVGAGADDAFSPDHRSVELLHSVGPSAASPRGYSCAGSPTAAAEAAGCRIFELQAFSPMDAGAAAAQSSRLHASEAAAGETAHTTAAGAVPARASAPSRSRFRELRAGLPGRVADAWLLQEPALTPASAHMLRRCEPEASIIARDARGSAHVAAAARSSVDDSVDADVSAACAVLEGADSIDVEALRPSSLSSALHDDACAVVEAMLRASASHENDDEDGFGDSDGGHDDDDDDDCSLRQTRSVYQPSSPSAVETEAF